MLGIVQSLTSGNKWRMDRNKGLLDRGCLTTGVMGACSVGPSCCAQEHAGRVGLGRGLVSLWTFPCVLCQLEQGQLGSGGQSKRCGSVNGGRRPGSDE